jgi:hypothetical protein
VTSDCSEGCQRSQGTLPANCLSRVFLLRLAAVSRDQPLPDFQLPFAVAEVQILAPVTSPRIPEGFVREDLRIEHGWNPADVARAA